MRFSPACRYPRQNALRGVVALADHAANFVVDFDRRGFAVIAMLVDLAAEEDLLFFLAEGQRSEIAHAEFADHFARQFRGALDVVACAGAHLVEEHLFGDAAAHHDGDFGFQIFLGVVVLVIDRQLHGYAQRHAARDDRDFVQADQNSAAWLRLMRVQLRDKP